MPRTPLVVPVNVTAECYTTGLPAPHDWYGYGRAGTVLAVAARAALTAAGAILSVPTFVIESADVLYINRGGSWYRLTEDAWDWWTAASQGDGDRLLRCDLIRLDSPPSGVRASERVIRGRARSVSASDLATRHLPHPRQMSLFG